MLKNGCITIDEYKATIENGEVTTVEKGNCSEITVDGEPPIENVPTIDSCPNCVFAYYSSSTVLDDGSDNVVITDYTNDYTTLQSNNFFGFVLNDDQTAKYIYSCKITDTEVICLKWSWGYDSMKEKAHTIFTEAQCSEDINEYGDVTKTYTCRDSARGLYFYASAEGPYFDINTFKFGGCTIKTNWQDYPVSGSCNNSNDSYGY